MSNHLDLIIRTADAELQSLGDSPYSKPAFAVLRDKISQYIAELVTESTRVAKRHKADTISAAHVNQASIISLPVLAGSSFDISAPWEAFFWARLWATLCQW